jgi:hypothetical protein
VKGVLLGVMLAAASQPAGDPLALVRGGDARTVVRCSGSLETMMLLAQFAGRYPALNDFQAEARSRLALYAGHAAIHETAALMQYGLGYQDLALFSTLMTQAPYFSLQDSPELKELASRLPGPDKEFNLDRLYGYSRLVREFYWDTRLGAYLRSSLAVYQQAARRPLPPGLPEARILVSPLAPTDRIEFTRRTPQPVSYVVLGEPAAR